MAAADLQQLLTLQQLQQAQQLQQVQQLQQAPLQTPDLQGVLPPHLLALSQPPQAALGVPDSGLHDAAQLAAYQQYLAQLQQQQQQQQAQALQQQQPQQPLPGLPQLGHPGLGLPQQLVPGMLPPAHLQQLSGAQLPAAAPVPPSIPQQPLTPAAAAVDQALKQQAEGGSAAGPFFSFDAPVETLRTTQDAETKQKREGAAQPAQAPAPLGQVKVLSKGPVTGPAPVSQSGQSSWVTVERRSRSRSRRRRRDSHSRSSSSSSSRPRGGSRSGRGRRERAAEQREEAASALFAAGKPKPPAKSPAAKGQEGARASKKNRPSILDQFEQQKQLAQQSREQQPTRQFTVEELLQGQPAGDAQPKQQQQQQRAPTHQQQQQPPQLPKGMEHLEQMLKRQQPQQQPAAAASSPQWQFQRSTPTQSPASRNQMAGTPPLPHGVRPKMPGSGGPPAWAMPRSEPPARGDARGGGGGGGGGWPASQRQWGGGGGGKGMPAAGGWAS